MQDGGISRQRSFCLPAGGLTTFSSRSDVIESGAKWSWAHRIFLPSPFSAKSPPSERLSHLFVFFVASFLWRSSEDKRKFPSLVTPEIEIFFKNPSLESPISTMTMRNSCATHFINRLLTSCHLRTLTYLTDFLFLARLAKVMVGSITSRCSGKWVRTHPPGRIEDRTREKAEIEPKVMAQINSKRTHPPPFRELSGIYPREVVNAPLWDQ